MGFMCTALQGLGRKVLFLGLPPQLEHNALWLGGLLRQMYRQVGFLPGLAWFCTSGKLLHDVLQIGGTQKATRCAEKRFPAAAVIFLQQAAQDGNLFALSRRAATGRPAFLFTLG